MIAQSEKALREWMGKHDVDESVLVKKEITPSVMTDDLKSILQRNYKEGNKKKIQPLNEIEETLLYQLLKRKLATDSTGDVIKCGIPIRGGKKLHLKCITKRTKEKISKRWENELLREATYSVEQILYGDLDLKDEERARLMKNVIDREMKLEGVEHSFEFSSKADPKKKLSKGKNIFL